MKTETTPKVTGTQWAALGSLLLPVLLISVDNTVLSFAIPRLSEALRPSASQLLWIIDIYSLMLAGLLVTMGTLGDRIGRRRLLLIGASGFGCASGLAALSTSAEMLIAARALLGVAGATLMPSTLSLLRNIFPDPRTRTTAIAAWTATFAGGGALGPVLGGWLLGGFWWGSVFLINLPVMALLLVLAPVLVPESRNPAPAPYDVTSAALSLVAMVSLLFGIKKFAEHGVSTVVVGTIAVAVVTGIVFLRRQQRNEAPMLDLRMFAHPAFRLSVAINLLSVFVFVGSLFFMTQYLQLVLGLSPLRAGVALLPGLALSITASLLAGRVLRRAPLSALLTSALLCAAAGYAIMALLPEHDGAGLMIAAFAVVGAGMGAIETTTNDTIMSTVAPSNAGAASAISETGYELGASLGTAVLGSVLTATYSSNLMLPPDTSSSTVDTARNALGNALAVADELPAEQSESLRTAALHAFVGAVHTTSLLGAAILACTAARAWYALCKR